jgi:hypothetical protein
MVQQSPTRVWGWSVGVIAALCGVCTACGAAVPATPLVAEEPPASLAPAGGAARVWLDEAVVAPGEPVTVHFTAPASFASDAWIGIVPALAPHGSEAACDQADVSYEYLSGRTSGDVTLAAPDRPGPWDVRMFDTDQNGREVVSTRFQVRTR